MLKEGVGGKGGETASLFSTRRLPSLLWWWHRMNMWLELLSEMADESFSCCIFQTESRKRLSCMPWCEQRSLFFFFTFLREGCIGKEVVWLNDLCALAVCLLNSKDTRKRVRERQRFDASFGGRTNLSFLSPSHLFFFFHMWPFMKLWTWHGCLFVLRRFAPQLDFYREAKKEHQFCGRQVPVTACFS